MPVPKEREVLTFKVDKELVNQLKGVPNRSEFIRGAILQALNNICPVCHGTGKLDGHSQKHWNELAKTHRKKQCKECHEDIFICAHT